RWTVFTPRLLPARSRTTIARTCAWPKLRGWPSDQNLAHRENAPEIMKRLASQFFGRGQALAATSSVRSHPGVRARRVLDHGQPAIPGLACECPAGGEACHPVVPDRPPRALL